METSWQMQQLYTLLRKSTDEWSDRCLCGAATMDERITLAKSWMQYYALVRLRGDACGGK